uniref:Uncharacterized protein n=1 Tax=Manihot esculenta TaxID=3983 RepID=A0A2C9WPH2_MANES
MWSLRCLTILHFDFCFTILLLLLVVVLLLIFHYLLLYSNIF